MWLFREPTMARIDQSLKGPVRSALQERMTPPPKEKTTIGKWARNACPHGEFAYYAVCSASDASRIFLVIETNTLDSGSSHRQRQQPPNSSHWDCCSSTRYRNIS